MLKNETLPQKVIGRDIIFFDGECVLCNDMVKKVIPADEDAHFLLGAQQSKTAREVLERHGVNVKDLSTVYVVRNCGTDKEDVLTHSSAVVYVLSKFRKYSLLGKLLNLVPKFLRDVGYRFVATNRYRTFGKMDEVCLFPTPENRERMVE